MDPSPVESFEQQLARACGFSAMVCVLSTLYLAAEKGALKSLVSMQGLIFLLMGMLLAALLAGLPFHYLQRGLAAVLSKAIPSPPKRGTEWLIRTAGTALMVLQVLATYYLTRLAYNWYFS